MMSLSNLSVQERDEILLTIPLVEDPENHGDFGAQRVHFGGRSVINYSQIYSDCRRCLSLPNPKNFRNGDIIQDGDYRGCGTFYVIWLHKGLVKHSEEYISNFKKDLTEYSESELKPDIPDTYRSMRKKAARPESIPRYISRYADGPHNDGDHDCYLCKHPDEYGYSPSTALSSASKGYYRKHLQFDEEMIYFDPLLTHSKSYMGKKIAAAKLTPKYVKKDSFPTNYLGYFDEGEEEIEWTSMTKTLSKLKR
jgi:hypothetical protein